MKKRNIFEKILLLILFLLALPFVLALFAIFIVIYIIIFLFEILFYRKSFYYKDLKEKYFTLITRTNNYQRYNKMIKNSHVKNNIRYSNEDVAMIYLNDTVTYDNDGSIWLYKNIEINQYLNFEYNELGKYVVIINKNHFDKESFKLAKTNDLFLIYSN